MARRAPVGTIRHWDSRGEVIKAFDGNLFDSGWIDLKTNDEVNSIGIRCDEIVNKILQYKEPFNGEVFLDHEILSFGIDDSGKGPYHPNDFKQYSGFYGTGQYSFRNEFSKRMTNKDIALADHVTSSLLDENSRNGGVNDGDNKHIVLDSQEIKEIRKTARFTFKFDNDVFNAKQAKELLLIIERTYDQLQQGLDLEGEDKKIYDEQLKIIS